jgi:hypothetical protein
VLFGRYVRKLLKELLATFSERDNRFLWNLRRFCPTLRRHVGDVFALPSFDLFANPEESIRVQAEQLGLLITAPWPEKGPNFGHTL